MYRSEIVNSHFWRFRSVSAVEELRQGALLNGMDASVGEPGGVARDDNVVCLDDRAVLLWERVLPR